MITIATLFWQKNDATGHYADGYSVQWVEKLYRGFARNLTVPFRFVCFTDRERTWGEPILTRILTNSDRPEYFDCLEAYRLDEPMILTGLDTVVTGNCDALARYCMEGYKIALPRDPYRPSRACNGVALVPAGNGHVWFDADRAALPPRTADMDRLRGLPHVFLDDIYPGYVVSYKKQVKPQGVGGSRIVYFHGKEKPHEIDADWIKRAWR